MPKREFVNRKVREARRILRAHGYDVKTTARDLEAWYRTHTPYEDGSLGDALKEPLIIIHELVEIELVKMMGLRLSRNVIMDNLEAVDRAHLEATRAELAIALKTGAVEHVRSRARDIEAWTRDSTVSNDQKYEYKKLLAETKEALAGLRKRTKSCH